MIYLDSKIVIVSCFGSGIIGQKISLYITTTNVFNNTNTLAQDPGVLTRIGTHETRKKGLSLTTINLTR